MEKELDPKNIVAQSVLSDECSVMSDEKSGVQMRIREIAQNPCYYVHCYAHRLRLVLASSIKDLPEFEQFFDLVANTINFIRVSSVRHAIFMRNQQELCEDVRCIQLPSVCRHKWEYNGKAVNLLLKCYEVVVNTLDELAETRSFEDRLMATGLLQSWQAFNNIFLLQLLIFMR